MVDKPKVEGSMASTLTTADVARLMAEPSPDVRAELAGKLATELDSPRLTESELKMAQDIVRVLARDVETSVRAALSQSLRNATRLPHDVAIKLAQDVELIALPILTNSSVLTDTDLLEIVHNSNAAKQEAIAGRSSVSEQVSKAIIATASESAVATLMGNAGAKIDEAGYTAAVDRFKDNAAIKEKIVKRPTLPLTVTERLVTLVSDSLKSYLVSHHELSPTVAADIVLQSRESTVISLASTSRGEELEKLITQMHANKRLTASILLRALCMGDMAFFETAMAVMSHIPLINARILIHDSGRLGLKSLYEKTGLNPRFLPAVRIAIDVVHETPLDGEAHDLERYRARVIERILTQYEDLGEDDIDYLLTKLGDILTLAA